MWWRRGFLFSVAWEYLASLGWRLGKSVHQILILFFWCATFGRLVLLLRCQEEAERSSLCVYATTALQTTLLEILCLYTIYIQLRRHVFAVRCVNFKLCHRLQRQVPNERSCCRTAQSASRHAYPALRGAGALPRRSPRRSWLLPAARLSPTVALCGTAPRASPRRTRAVSPRPAAAAAAVAPPALPRPAAAHAQPDPHTQHTHTEPAHTAPAHAQPDPHTQHTHSPHTPH